MGSFAAIHVRGQETEQLADVIERWLRPAGFGTRVWTDSATWPEHRIWGPAKTVVLGRLTDIWHVLHFGGFSLANDGLSASGLRRLGGLVGDRIVFFAAQTTSSAYELVVLDGPAVVRHLASSDHELLEDVGEHLEGEPDGGAFRYPEDEHGEWSFDADGRSERHLRRDAAPAVGTLRHAAVRSMDEEGVVCSSPRRMIDRSHGGCYEPRDA
jgi:hypothetical protein